MVRRAQRARIPIALFLGALLLVLYLNTGGSGGKPLAWTTIRYQTTSDSVSLLSSHGKCPGLSKTSKPALVVSRITTDDDPTWLQPLRDKYHICMYTNDLPPDEDASTLHVPANRGHEAMAYLTFIISNYADLPSSGAVFIHGARRAWHNDAPDYDNLHLLRDLNVSRALSFAGYHNLRCDWSAGTCDRAAAAVSPASFETRVNALLDPFDKRLASDAALPGVFASLFGTNSRDGKVKLGSADILRAQCCAQFVVSRERIQQHDLEEYQALRQWLLDDEQRGGAPRDDRVSGRILSYLWHVLFLPQRGEGINVMHSDGEGMVDLAKLNALACPSTQECYCRLYGKCDLEGCREEGRCEGEYVLPPDYKVPEVFLTAQR